MFFQKGESSRTLRFTATYVDGLPESRTLPWSIASSRLGMRLPGFCRTRSHVVWRGGVQETRNRIHRGEAESARC